MNERVLLVDDEPNVLHSFQRIYRGACKLEVANGAEVALRWLEENGEVAVVISDMQMPGMNGVEFLSKVQQMFPYTVRLMLTGNADQQTAMRAINEGQIFRFLTKPCQPPDMLRAIKDAIEQHRLLKAEVDTLNRTVNGVIATLTSILSLSWPEAFGTAQQAREIARDVAKELNIDPLWPIEIAAMLSRIGCVSLDEDLARLYFAGETLTQAQQQLVDDHTKFGRQLLSNIPRLEIVAEIVGHMHDLPTRAPLESRLVRVVAEYQRHRTRKSHADSVNLLRDPLRYDQKIVALLDQVLDRETEVQHLPLVDLKPGMILDESIVNQDSMVLVGKSVEVHEALLHKLSAYRRSGQGIREPIRVRIPRDASLKRDLKQLELVNV